MNRGEFASLTKLKILASCVLLLEIAAPSISSGLFRVRMIRARTAPEALEFVRRHGVVLEAGRGPVANLDEAIVAGPIPGSGWGHSKGKLIFRLTHDVRDEVEVMVCRVASARSRSCTRGIGPRWYG
ncbi:MAG: hypothetical protein WD793_13900 [Steroidobacteraceae bacterium]